MKNIYQSTLVVVLVSLSFFLLPHSPVVAEEVYSQLVNVQSEQVLTSVKAWVSNKKPKQNSTVSAYCEVKDQNGKAIVGTDCTFKWKYKTTTKTMTAITGQSGQAMVSRKIGRATKGKKVEIVVTAVYKGVTKTTTTGFIPK